MSSTNETLAREIERIIHENSATIAMNMIMTLIESNRESYAQEKVLEKLRQLKQGHKPPYIKGNAEVILNAIDEDITEIEDQRNKDGDEQA